MNFFLLGAAVITAFGNWLSVGKNWRTGELFTKPAVMILLLAWLLQNQLINDGMIWFSLGIFFSLAGDSFLLAKGEKTFLAGLVSFLLAHVAYIIGFNQVKPAIAIPLLLPAAVLLITAWILFRKLNLGLKRQNANTLQIPVGIYTLVITIMVISALFSFARPGWDWKQAALVFGGALLFMASDSLLAWNKFVQPVPNAHLIVMISYHLGQIGILLGAALHYI